MESDTKADLAANLVQPEPPPTANDLRPSWDLVIDRLREMRPRFSIDSNETYKAFDLLIGTAKARDAFGRGKYGTPLQPFNGRDSLKNAFQEALDLIVYLENVAAESDAMKFRVFTEQAIYLALRIAVEINRRDGHLAGFPEAVSAPPLERPH